MIIPAGAKVSAELLADALPLMAMVVNDTTVTNSTTFVEITGLVLPLAASSTYLIDGYVAYSAGATGDAKFGWACPDGWAGHWSLMGLTATSTGSVGSLVGVRITPIEASAVALGGSDAFDGALAARLQMFVETDATAGNLQLRVGQLVSNGTPTIARQGSWLRAQKIT